MLNKDLRIAVVGLGYVGLPLLLLINKKFKVQIITGNTLNNNHNGNWLNTPWYLQPESLTNI